MVRYYKSSCVTLIIGSITEYNNGQLKETIVVLAISWLSEAVHHIPTCVFSDGEKNQTIPKVIINYKQVHNFHCLYAIIINN